MSYLYTEFDGVALSVYNFNQDHDPMPSDSTLQESLGGTFDWRGATRQPGRRQTITLQGVYFGETEYFVTETGERLVTETGEPLIAGDATQMLNAQVAALLEKKGVRGPLWRERGAGLREWKTARLLAVNWPRVVTDRLFRAELRCQFETEMEYWHAETESSVAVNTTSGTPAALVVANSGQTIDDAVLTIASTSGTLTAISVTCASLGIALAWMGSLTNGSTLTIDNGTQTVPAGTTDAYSGFSLGSGHTAAGWLPITPGTHVFEVTATGGNATVTLSFFHQFA